MKSHDAVLPHFSQIKPENIEKELTAILDDNLQQIDNLLKQPPFFNWENLMRPLENLETRLHNFWTPINHLHGVKDSAALRDVYNNCIPKLTDYSTRLHHNEKLFQAIQSVMEQQEDFNLLDPAQQKVLQNEVRDFRLSGIDLSPYDKEIYAKLTQQLAQLQTKFEENLLDATHGWVKHVKDHNDLRGLPEDTILLAEKLAQKRNEKGWILTLDAPCYIAVMKYAECESLREEMYRAYNTRASDQGPTAGQWDNTPVIQEILKIRLELSRLLGFNNYAELSLATKMVPNTEDVLKFLTELAGPGLAKAKEEFVELKQFAQDKYGVSDFNIWDVPFYSEKLRIARYAISQEDLRPYFPEDRVIAGLFETVKRLFQMEVRPVKDAEVWHPDVRCYAMYDSAGELRSYFYFDLYAREKKRGGAWMDDCRVRRKLDDGRIQKPVAFVTCNFTAPVNGKPALFTHDEVVTLFHEFGHALQHMLTRIDYADVSGINGIPWDAVEVASQFLEHWAWEKESLQFISGHYETGEPIPDAIFEKMQLAKNFQSALQMVRQLEFSLFDFRLHLEFDPSKENQVQKILDDVRRLISVFPTPRFNRFQNSFAHIFGGSYAAGYYSYKWAEVMAADAFSLFKELGIFNSQVSQKFLNTFLESGGARDPMELFIEFRGRKPEIRALLEQSGIK